MLLHSDGVSRRFDLSKYPHIRQDPQRVAEQIMEEWGKETDDATIIIVSLGGWRERRREVRLGGHGWRRTCEDTW